MAQVERIGGNVAAQNAAGLAHPAALAETRVLPVVSALAGLLPEGGLRRGTTVAVSGTGGAASLALALIAAASAAGSWCAVVTIGDLGMVAADEAGLDLARVALLCEVPPDQWPTAVGALIDSVDVVVVSPPPHLRVGDARRLSTRARERGAVLITLGSWGERVEVHLRVAGSSWQGVERGHGRLVARQVEVTANGRGAAARQRRVRLWLPARRGAAVATVDAPTIDAVATVDAPTSVVGPVSVAG